MISENVIFPKYPAQFSARLRISEGENLVKSTEFFIKRDSLYQRPSLLNKYIYSRINALQRFH